MAQGHAYITAAIENDAWMQFNGVKFEGKTYVESLADDLVKIAKEKWNDGSQSQNST